MSKTVSVQSMKRSTSVEKLMSTCSTQQDFVNQGSRKSSILVHEGILRHNSTNSDDDEYSIGASRCNRSIHSQGSMDQLSDSSSLSIAKAISRGKLQELLQQVKKRAHEDLPPPEFVPKFEELIDATKRRKGKNSVALNVMGCQQSLDIILAKADRLIRRQKLAFEIKERVCAEKVKHINELIESKESRGQRFAHDIRRQQTQFFLLRAMNLVFFLKGVKPIYEFMHKRQKRLTDSNIVTEIIASKIKIWLYRSHQHKFLEFLRQVRPHRLWIVLYVRIFRKRRAARCIRHYLTEAKDNEIMRARVKKVLRCVRLLQRVGRDFIACKRERARVLNLLLDKIERKYIRDMLRRRKTMRWNTSKSFLSEIRLDNRTLNEMNKQDRIWDATDAKMESILQIHRQHGLLQKLTEEAEVEKHLLSHRARMDIAHTVIAQKRQEHLRAQREAYKKIVVKKQFDAEDALAMLRGDDGVLNMAVNLLKPRRFADFVPFAMFKFLKHTELLELIRFEHDTLQTFVVRQTKVVSRPTQAQGGGCGRK